MAENYKIREVEVEISSGVKLTVELTSIDEVKALLRDLDKVELPIGSLVKSKPPVQGAPEPPSDPLSRLEARAGIKSGALSAKKIIAFKNDVPQLMRPSALGAVTEVTLVLLFSLEAGLKKKSISYESFKALFDEQNIKSGSPLPMLLTNLRNSNYIEKKVYSSDRTLILTAKGEERAIEVLKALVPSQ
jgi:hypothetical protein